MPTKKSNKTTCKNSRKSKLGKKGRKLSEFERERYGSSRAIRYIKASGEPIYPIGYVKPKPPISKAENVNMYTVEGRCGLHKNIKVDISLLIELMKKPNAGASTEFADNKLSLYSAQRGRCAVTQRLFKTSEEVHCHHIKPKAAGGTDQYQNLTLVLDSVHKLIHAQTKESIDKYLTELELTEFQISKVNKYRVMAGNNKIMI